MRFSFVRTIYSGNLLQISAPVRTLLAAERDFHARPVRSNRPAAGRRFKESQFLSAN